MQKDMCAYVTVDCNQNSGSSSLRMGHYTQIVKGLRTNYETGRTKDISFRLTQMKNLLRLYEENTDDLIKALGKDLRKPRFEGYMYEILLLIRDLKLSIKKLASWTEPRKVAKNLLSLSDNVYYTYQPHGVVLVLGPWNYPFHLTLMPVAGAIAAGNCVLIKPSEMSSHCADMMSALIPKYLDQECYKVVQGDSNETQLMLKEKFDFIFFTGSSQIGKIIYSQAALTLTPVCLELGGKSPVYIDSSADIRMAAERIMWAKCVCVGQTCISPDYVLCTKEVELKFVEEVRKVLYEFYGENLQDNKDLSRIINAHHFARVRRLLNETRGTIAVGGTVDEYDLFIEPTIIVGVDEHEPAMTEEIFGPLLPIFPVRNAKDAIDFVNNRPNPLALYVFCKKQKVIDMFLEKTNSGGVCINDSLYHTSVLDVPFGGLGESGLGQYHGKFSFKTFSRPKTVVHRTFCALENRLNYSMRYPPYNAHKFQILKFAFGNFEMFYIRTGFLPYLLCFFLGLLVMYFIYVLNLFKHSSDSKY